MQELLNQYKQNVEELVELLKNKIVVFDLDGVITQFKYAEDRLLPCKDDDLNRYHMYHNMYATARISKTIKYIIDKLDKDSVYILTVTNPNLVLKKHNMIKENYPDIKDENVFYAKDSDDKLVSLIEINNHNPSKEMFFIEDNPEILLNAEEKLDFVRGYHISSLIP